jgi:hypothetical protein
MLSIYETPTFVAEAAKIWTSEERLAFFAWIASEPEAGVVIPGSGGCRKP